jgi:hypothetical protein
VCVLYFPEAAYDRCRIELFEREVIQWCAEETDAHPGAELGTAVT